ncbi:DUF559 domain-containing protein [bacterium]|nr:DUF559 domain-containing protein [bacterium]
MKVPTKDKLRITGYSYKLRRRPTKAELAMKRILNSLGIDYIFQKRIRWYIADFYLTKRNRGVIVEVDGEYHKYRTDYDKRRDELLRREGFEVIRFTNKEVLNFPEVVKEKLKSFLKGKQPRKRRRIRTTKL